MLKKREETMTIILIKLNDIDNTEYFVFSAYHAGAQVLGKGGTAVLYADAYLILGSLSSTRNKITNLASE